jgi:hypothetical protein
MMARVPLYGYATGVYSSRKIQTKTYDDVGFRFLSADEHPDHSTPAEFRKRPEMRWENLFGFPIADATGQLRRQDPSDKESANSDTGSYLSPEIAIPDRLPRVGWQASPQQEKGPLGLRVAPFQLLVRVALIAWLSFA